MADRVGYGAPGTTYPYPPPYIYSAVPSNSNFAPNLPSGYTPIPSEYAYLPPTQSTGSYPETSAPLGMHEPPVNTLAEPDPSYSPRVPEYDGVLFEIPAGASSASAPSWDYPNNSSSGYNPADQYIRGYTPMAPIWSNEREEPPVNDHQAPRTSGYLSQPVLPSGYLSQSMASAPTYDHQVPAPTYDHQVPPPSGSWYTPPHVSGYDYDYKTPSLSSSMHEKPYVENKSSASEHSGVYAYDGASTQPYGARGTGASSWKPEPLDDFPKLVKALPKVETESKGSGIQKFHVKVVPDSSTAMPMNVICQIGLDGLRLVDPSSNMILRIHPLDTITRWEVNEPSIFMYWTKSPTDFEQRRTRLQSSRATTNAILDTLTAACVQLSEMVDKEDKSKSTTTVNDSTEKPKKSFFQSWLSSKPQVQEEKDHWVPDEEVKICRGCSAGFTTLNRRHHCRNCGEIFCEQCSRGRTALTSDPDAPSVRVCDNCLAEITHRLTNSRETSSSKFAVQQSHEDLAKKLKEEMDRNATRKSPVESGRTTSTKSGQSIVKCNECGTTILGNMSKCPSCGSDGGRNGSYESSRRRTKEVACPTCTVHLEVEIPVYGVNTVECGVCQHPFIVKA